jgi:hypothetical protein
VATITVRALGPNGDPLQGNGQNCFISDLAAVTQIIGTRLKMFEGEFWQNLLDGLPLFQQILGSSGSQRNLQVIIGLISQRITGTVFVTGINSISATYTNRNFVFNAVVQTQFGVVYVNNSPASSATLTATS